MQEILRGNIDYRISKFSNTQEFSRIEEAFNRVLDYSRDLKTVSYTHLDVYKRQYSAISRRSMFGEPRETPTVPKR